MNERLGKTIYFNPNFSNKAVLVGMVHPLAATALSTPMTTTDDLGKSNI